MRLRLSFVGMGVVLAAASAGFAQSGLALNESAAVKVTSVSVRPTPEPYAASPVWRTHVEADRVTLSNITVETMIRDAYASSHVTADAQIENAPDWVRTARFDIEARGANFAAVSIHYLPGHSAPPGQGDVIDRATLQIILRAVLERDFRLAFTRQSRYRAGYALVALDEADDKADEEAGDAGNRALPQKFRGAVTGMPNTANEIMLLNGRLTMINGSTNDLAQQLSNLLDEPVMNKTGAERAGLEDIDLQLTAPKGQTNYTARPDPYLANVLRTQLGMALVPNAMPAEVLTIEHIDSIATIATVATPATGAHTAMR